MLDSYCKTLNSVQVVRWNRRNLLAAVFEQAPKGLATPSYQRPHPWPPMCSGPLRVRGEYEAFGEVLISTHSLRLVKWLYTPQIYNAEIYQSTIAKFKRGS